MLINQLIAFVVAVLIVSLMIFASGKVELIWLFAVYLATILWAVADVSRMRFKDYRVSYPYGPYTTFFFCLILWPFAFPWFLSSWLDIYRGIAKRHDEAPDSMSPLVESMLKEQQVDHSNRDQG